MYIFVLTGQIPTIQTVSHKHNAQSTLWPFRNAIDYMVFTPLRAKGQRSSSALNLNPRPIVWLRVRKQGAMTANFRTYSLIKKLHRTYYWSLLENPTTQNAFCFKG